MNQKHERYLQTARDLIAAVERDDEAAVDACLDEFTRVRETELFRELGMLTRQLHESLNAFRLDTRLADLTENEIPDARERLTYVITMTEQAAHRTLNSVEDSMSTISRITDIAGGLAEQWQRFRNRELSVEEFRELSRDIENFLEQVREDAGGVHAMLTEALMAQDYQDLTGQIIRRVIDLVHELEENLVRLVRLSGPRRTEESAQPADNNDNMKLEGPQVPGTAKDEAAIVHGQDEVDDCFPALASKAAHSAPAKVPAWAWISKTTSFRTFSSNRVRFWKA